MTAVPEFSSSRPRYAVAAFALTLSPVLFACPSSPSPAPTRPNRSTVDSKKPDSDSPTNPTRARLRDLGTVRGATHEWPQVPPPDARRNSLVLGRALETPTLSLAFDHLRWESTVEAIDAGTMTIGVAVRWPIRGLWLEQRGGRPRARVDSVQLTTGSKQPVRDCEVLDADPPRPPSARSLTPNHDIIRGCAVGPDIATTLRSVTVAVEREVPDRLQGFELSAPREGDRIAGPGVDLIIDAVGERNLDIRIEGESRRLWNVTALDAEGKAVDITMVKGGGEQLDITWRRKPARLRAEFSRPASQPGKDCDDAGRCATTTRHVLDLTRLPTPANKLERPAAKPRTAEAPVTDESWHRRVQGLASERRAIAYAGTQHGAIVLQALQAGNWLAPWLDVWRPYDPELDQSYGLIDVRITSIAVKEADAKKARRHRAGKRDWTAPAHLTPALVDPKLMLGSARLDLGQSSEFTQRAKGTFRVTRLEGEITRRAPKTTRQFSIPVDRVGVWTANGGNEARVRVLSTRGIELEFKGGLDELVAVRLRDVDGNPLPGFRHAPPGPCQLPGDGRNATHLCLATRNAAVGAIDIELSRRFETSRENFVLDLTGG